MTRIFDIPKIVCGQEILPESDDNSVAVSYAGGATLRIARLTEQDIDCIMANRVLLHDIPVAEVTGYLNRGGAEFGALSNPLTAEAVERCCATTGYSTQMVARDYRLIGGYLSYRNVLYDLLDAEIGDWRMLDSWVRRQVARVRAFPRGRALHVTAGNVPVSGIYSLLRSVLTKNHTVVKLPSRDLISCLYFARALILRNEPGHRLSRSISVVYCDPKDPMFDRLVLGMDVVCAWGQGESLAAIKAKIPQGIPFVEFGPKRSLSVVFAEDCDPDDAAMRIAHDVALYDQEACFSPQRLFVIGDPVRLVGALSKWLDVQQQLYPKGTITDDEESHIVRARLEAVYRGHEVVTGSGWNIIVASDPDFMLDHPLGRTVFLHPVASLADVVRFVDDDTQSVSVYPYTGRAEQVGDALCARGAARICEAGMIAYFRQGFTHDGTYPLQQFVRLAYLDEGLGYVYKYGNTTEEQYKTRFFGVPA